MNDPIPNSVEVSAPDVQLQAQPMSIIEAISIMALLIGAALLGYGLLLSPKGFDTTKFLVPTAAGAIFTVAGLASLVKIEKKREAARRVDVQIALADSTTDYFERLASINVENLSVYYVTVKSHANKSFYASLGAGIVGFILIATGIRHTISTPTADHSAAVLSAVSGVATEFISAVFFYLYSQTVRQMKGYHDSLLAVQNVLLSFKLVDDTNDPIAKVKMTEMMLTYLVGSRKSAKAQTDPNAEQNSTSSSQRHTSEPI